ncbi:MAG: sugar phosphate isomerase/epimerase [Oscillospiraceae bacterium]|nr:sugar phosphate isomerase/epimerase [Oscillospiraceae bacterium]
MIISTQTDRFAARFGDHDAIKLLAQVGFDALDYSMFSVNKNDKNNPVIKDDYREYAQSLRKTADENNIVFNQSHAPFPSYKQNIPRKDNKGNDEYNENIVYYIVRAMEITSILGGKITIVHPITLEGCGYQAQKEFNINFYRNLLPYCKKFNVKIALENMWGWDDINKKVTPAACSTVSEFTDYLDSLDKDWFCACLDTGHAEMQGTGGFSAAEFINALGHDRLKALHVHDNDKIGDLHTLPFTEKLKWDDIITALKNINYSGDFTFEADNFIAKFPTELSLSASRLMLDVGRYFTAIL